MAWSDRAYAYEDQPWRPRQGQNGLYWLLGVVFGAHVLKVLLVGLAVLGEGDVERWFGVSRRGLTQGWVWQPLTYQFVHAGAIGHVAINLLVLFLVGRILEPLKGSRRLVLSCLLCGAVGAFGVFFPGGGGVPTVGISGGISGLWVIAWCLVPNLPLNLIFFVVRLKWVAAFFLVADLLLALGGGHGTVGSPSVVAYWSHLMGAFGGFCWAWLWPRLVKPRIDDMRVRARRRREVARFEREMSDERELDRILVKINREGMPSLTEQERRFLRKSASRYQDSRRP